MIKKEVAVHIALLVFGIFVVGFILNISGSSITGQSVRETQLVIPVNGNLSCQYRQNSCAFNETKLLAIVNETNAHAELPNETNYPLFLCCNDTSGNNSIGTSSSGTSFLHFGNFTNSHIELFNETNMSINAYISASANDINCSVQPTGEGACPVGQTCMGTLSANDNAHLGNCSAYNITVCCGFGGRTTIYVPPTAPPASNFSANGSVNGTLNATETSYVTQFVTYLNETTGKKFVRFEGRFNQTSVNMTNLAVEFNDTALAINASGVSGVESNHTLFLNSTVVTNIGVRFCPSAVSLSQVNSSCSGGFDFRGPFPQTQSGITVSLSGGEYVIDNVTGSGASLLNAQNVSSCPTTITVDSVLNQSLSCSAEAIIFGADNITFDCNGFNISYANSASGIGINATVRSNVTVRNCVLRSGSQANSDGVLLSSTNSSEIRNLSINTSSSSGSNGVSANSGTGNLVRDVVSYGSTYGLFMSAPNITLINVYGRGTHGIHLGSSNNTLINGTGNALGGAGLFMNFAQRHSVFNSTGITTSGQGIAFDTSSNINMVNVSGLAQSGTAMTFFSSFNNSVLTALLNTSGSWIFHGGSGSGNNVTNVTFNSTNASLFIEGNVTIPGDLTVNLANLEMIFNSVFLNSSNISFLNRSAQITLRNITFGDPRLLVDFEDDGTFAVCNATQCQEVSYASGVYVFNVSSFTRYTTQESCPLNVTSSTTLTHNVTCAGIAVVISASNVTFDCNGFTVAYASEVNGTGINVTGVQNVTVRNCKIVQNLSQRVNSHGIFFSSSSSGAISNNTVNVTGGQGIRLEGDSSANSVVNNSVYANESSAIVLEPLFIGMYVENNTVSGNNGSSVSERGLYLSGSNGNNITNNTGFSVDDRGIYLSSANNNLLERNNGSSTNFFGLSLSGSSNNIIRFNNASSGSGTALSLALTSDFNVVMNNSAVSLSSIALSVSDSGSNNLTNNSAVGSSAFMVSASGSDNNRVLDNVAVGSNNGFTLSGDAGNNTLSGNIGYGGGICGIQFNTQGSGNILTGNVWRTNSGAAVCMTDSVNNTFSGDNFSANSGVVLQFQVSAQNNTFNGGVLESNATWITSDSDSSSNNVTNITFNDPLDGSVRLIPTIVIPNGTSVGLSGLNVLLNRSFINSSNYSFLNVSAQITLRSLSFTDPRPLVDFEDDGSFTVCGSPQCVEDSYNGSTFVFNVSSFTSYSTQEAPLCPLNVTVNTTLTGNIECPGTAVSILTSNVVFDCAGFSINYSDIAEGFGVNISGFNNVTVKNCVIFQSNTSLSSSDGVSAVSSNNVSVLNSTVNATGPSSSAVVFSAGTDDFVANSTLESNKSTGLELSGTISAVARNVTIFADNGVQDIVTQRTLLDNISARCISSSAVQIGQASNFSIKNSNVLCNSGNPGINFQTAQDSAVNNVTVTATLGTGVNIANARNISVTNSSVSDYLIQSSTIFVVRNVTANESATIFNAGNGTIDNSTFFSGSSTAFAFTNASNVTMSNSSMVGSFKALTIFTSSSNITVVDSFASGGSNGVVDIASGSQNVTLQRVQANMSGSFPAIHVGGPFVNVFESNASNAGSGLGLRINASNAFVRGVVAFGGSAGGILLNFSHNSTVINTSANATSGVALQVLNTSESNVTNVTASSATGMGMLLISSTRIIAVNSNGSSGSSVAVNLSGGNNNTLQNVSAVGSSGIGLAVGSSSNNTFSNNTATSNTNYGLFLDSSSNNQLSRNTVTSNNGVGEPGLRIFSSSNNQLSSNTVTSSSVGFALTSSSNNTFSNNTVTGSSAGLVLTSSSNNQLSNNTVASNTSTGLGLFSSSNNILSNNIATSNTSVGLVLQSSSNNNTLNNNTVTSSTGVGLILQVSSNNNTISNNTVGSNTNFGLFLSASSNNTFSNNTITSNTSVGLRLTSSSNNNSLVQTTIYTNSTWITADSTSAGNTLADTLFEDNNGSIRVFSAVLIAPDVSVNLSNLNVTPNEAFLNSTNLSFLNVSSRITLRGLTLATPVLIRDVNDDGVFEYCSASVCALESFSSGSLVFNVTGFTAFSSTGNISIDKFDSADPVVTGGLLDYTIRINNSGNDTMFNVTVVETYPAGVVFVTSSPAPVSGNTTFVLASLANNSVFDINITVNLSSLANGTLLNNSYNVTWSNGLGQNTTLNDSETTLVLGAPAIVTSKSDSTDPVLAGTQLAYQIVVNNTGDDYAFNVTVVDAYPVNVTFHNSTPTSLDIGGTTFSAGNLSPNQSFIINITVNVSPSVQNGVVLNNTYNLTFANSSGQTVVVSNFTETTVTGIANVTLEKIDSPDPVNASNGTVLNYTIIVNVTNGIARNATVVEVYDANVTFISSEPAPTIANSTFALGNLTSEFRINISVLVNSGINNGTVITNRVNLSWVNETNETRTLFQEVNTTALSTVFNSNVTNSTVNGSNITNSNVSNSNITNSSVVNSTKQNSNVTLSSNTGCIVNGSSEQNVSCSNSNITNSTKVNSNITLSSNTGCLVNGSSETNTTCANSNITNSQKINSTVTGSSNLNCVIINTTESSTTCVDSNSTHSTKSGVVMTNASNTLCTVTSTTETTAVCVNSTLSSSTVIDSSVSNSTKTNSTLLNASIEGSNNTNCIVINSTETASSCSGSTINNSVVINSTLQPGTVVENATIINGQCTAGTIVFNGQTFTCPVALSTVYASGAGGGFGGGGGGAGRGGAGGGAGMGAVTLMMSANELTTPPLKQSDRVQIPLTDGMHSLSVAQVSADRVTLVLQSAPQIHDLRAGSRMVADANIDGVPDLEIEVLRLGEGKVVLHLRKLSQSSPAIALPEFPSRTVQPVNVEPVSEVAAPVQEVAKSELSSEQNIEKRSVLSVLESYVGKAGSAIRNAAVGVGSWISGVAVKAKDSARRALNFEIDVKMPPVGDFAISVAKSVPWAYVGAGVVVLAVLVLAAKTVARPRKEVDFEAELNKINDDLKKMERSIKRR